MVEAAADPNAPQPSDTPQAFAAKWIAALEQAEKDKSRQRWLKRARAINKLYAKDEDESAERRKFSLFWSNINTLAPAVYARTPTAVVSRRFKDEDPVGRMASEVLERALNFSVEAYDFAAIMQGARDAYLLIASGQAWVRYVPHMKTVTAPAAPVDPDGQITSQGEDYEVVDWEESRADLLNFEDFGHNVARHWSEVTFVWRRSFQSRAELVARFGQEIGSKVPLDWSAKSANDEPRGEDGEKAAIYEIWDITSKQAIWISRGYPDGPLDKRDDPLGLTEFFPCPRPLLGTTGLSSIVPTPDFTYYQAQLKEVDKLTQRIDKLLDALKVRGFYAADNKSNLDTLLSSETGTMIPVDSWAALQDKGGIKGLVEWFPVDMVVAVLKGCFDARKQIIDDVYQVTGISDILRGDTDPNETAAAQKIKSNWGASRVRDRQKELARFARDLFRIKGEVIASKFGQPTLAAMTGVKMLTAAEKAQAMQAMQAWQQLAQQAQQPPLPGAPPPPPPPPCPVPPQVQQMLQSPTWDDVLGLLQDKALRSFRIDIETDSTIEPNDQEEKQRRVEFVTGVGKFLAESLPVVQAAPQMLPVITEGLKFLVRGFRVGREMEETIDRCLDQLQQAAANAPPGGAQQKPGPDRQAEVAKANAAQMNAQANMGKVQVAQGHLQVESQKVQLNHQAEMAGVAAEQQRTAVDAHLGQQDHMREVIQNAEDRRVRAEINSTAPITAPTR